VTGKIIKAVGGFFYVHVEPDKLNDASHIYECKAAGRLRSMDLRPSVGDDVIFDIIDAEKMTGNIVDILPRKNILIRPFVANVDQALVVVACKDPEPNTDYINRFMILMQQANVPQILCFNKSDLLNGEIAKLAETYEKAGVKCIVFSAKEADEGDVSSIYRHIEGKTTVFAGPSGVGKSSIINLLQDNITMQTGHISEKIRRGKHTTRHAELIYAGVKTYIVDTPGFTSIEINDIKEDELVDFFPEIKEAGLQCRFPDCRHMKEPDCNVKLMVKSGEIARLRYDGYVSVLKELQQKKKVY